MKKYIVVRLKKRWPIVPATGIFALYAILRQSVDGSGRPLPTILFLAGFALLGILFPFHWGGEQWDRD